MEDELRGTLAVKNLPPTLQLPKVKDLSHIELFAEQLVSTLNEKKF